MGNGRTTQRKKMSDAKLLKVNLFKSQVKGVDDTMTNRMRLKWIFYYNGVKVLINNDIKFVEFGKKELFRKKVLYWLL